MPDSNLKQQTISGLIWQFIQKTINQLISFAVTVILARLLMPEDYGVVALAGMFNILIGVFLDNGLGSALIQKKEADELDYNTVFYSNLFCSCLIYGAIYCAAPFCASAYHQDLICPIMRVMSLTIPLNALSVIQSSIISRRLQFKVLFYAGIIGNVVSAMVGISMAYRGFGPWALVGQLMISSITSIIVNFYIIRWYPKFQFSWGRFREMFSYAWKKQVAGAIGTLCFQLKGYLIGYRYSVSDLAYYNRGEGLPEMFMTNVNGSINGVLFPALSKLQNDPQAIKRGIRRSMMTSSYVLCPLLFGLAAMAEQIVPVLYSDKWTPAIPFMQVACLTCCMTVLNTANLQALLAIGRSDEVLKLEIYKKPVMVAILAVAVFISPIAISIGLFVYSIYVLMMNTIPNKKYIDYSIREQINDVKPSFLLSGFMAIIVYLVGYVPINVYFIMLIQFFVGVSIYLSFSYVFKLEAYEYVYDTITKLVGKRIKK